MKIYLLLILSLTLITLVSADIYDDCSIYGTCEVSSTTTLVTSGNGTNITNYWKTDTTQTGLTGDKSGNFSMSIDNLTLDSALFYGNIYSPYGDGRVMDVQNRWLYSLVDNITVDFGNERLMAGGTVRFDWLNRLLYGNWNSTGILTATNFCYPNGTCLTSGSGLNATQSSQLQNISLSLGQNCPTGQVHNGTRINGTWICVNPINSTIQNLLNQNCPNGLVVNGTYNNGTFKCINPINATYLNTSRLLNQNCPSGQVVNGTYGNGTFKCTTVSGSSFLTNQDNNNLNKTANVTFSIVNVSNRVMITQNQYVPNSSTTKNKIGFTCTSGFPNTYEDMCVVGEGPQISYGGSYQGVKQGYYKIDNAGNVFFGALNQVGAETGGFGYFHQAWATTPNKRTLFGSYYEDGNSTVQVTGSLLSKTGIECQGTLSDCVNFNETQCPYINGCGWNLCTGTASACSTFSEGDCEGYGCTKDFNCGGTHNPCTDYTDDGQSICESHICSWDTASCDGSLNCGAYNEADCGTHNAVCSQNYHSCTELPYPDCNAVAGCTDFGDHCQGNYFYSCDNNGGCYSLGEADCPNYAGCGWDLADCYGTPHDCSTIDDNSCNAHGQGCSLSYSSCTGTASACSTWDNNEVTCEGAGCTFNNDCTGSILNTNCNQLTATLCYDNECNNSILTPSFILKNDLSPLVQQNISSMGDDVYFETNNNGSWIFKNGTGYGTIIAGNFITASQVAKNNTKHLNKLNNFNEWTFTNGTINYDKHYANYTETIQDTTKWIKVKRNVTECKKNSNGMENCKVVTIEVNEHATKTFKGLNMETRVAELEGMIYDIKICIAKWDGKKDTLQNCIGSL